MLRKGLQKGDSQGTSVYWSYVRVRIKWWPASKRIYPHSYITADSWNTLGEAKAAPQPQSLEPRLPQSCSIWKLCLGLQSHSTSYWTQDIQSTILPNVHIQIMHMEH